MADDLSAFAEALRRDLRDEADIEGSEAMLSEVFTRRMIETLIETGEVEELVDCYHRDDSVRPAVEVSGYGVEDGETLNLVATVYTGAEPGSVSRADITRAARRAKAFWRRCRDRPYHDDLEESSDAWDMALQIHRGAGGITRVRVFVVTDGLARIEWVDPEQDEGIEYRDSVWDLNRLWRYENSGRRGEPIEVDFVERFGRPLAVLQAPGFTPEFRAFLAVVPGEVLAAIYDEYGSRLLERNVRSFLQFTGKVNRGMRDTLRKEPEHFLAFNNGISATASSVELVDHPEGGLGIARMQDLQIVNGGQTTASVHRADRMGVDVSSVGVQAKITEVQGDLLDELVPRISEYANSQNKVQVADLSSNLPFHIELQSLSRNTWAPATAETGRETKWFYERARGQYADARALEPTRSTQQMFQRRNPPRQRFSKVDVATYENTWSQLPHEVSKGAQKNFGHFMSQVNRRGPEYRPDVRYFREVVAKAIVFRSAEKIVGRMQFGGYRRNIVTYALARLVHATEGRIDLDAIWRRQSIDPLLVDAIEELAHQAFGVLTDPGRPVGNVTEWAKREQCWEVMRRSRWTPGDGLLRSLTSSGRQRSAQGGPEAVKSEDVLPAMLGDATPELLEAVSTWAKQTDSLTGFDRRFAATLATSMRSGRPITSKQAPAAQRILETAYAAGFTYSPGSPGEESVL